MEPSANRFKRSPRNSRILRESGFVLLALAVAGLAHAQSNPSSGATPDVVGIKVGISRVAETRAALAAVTPALAVGDVETQLMGQSSSGYAVQVKSEGGKYLSHLQAVTRSIKGPGRENNWSCPGGGDCEWMRVIFSGPPGGGVAVNVMRRVDFSSGPSLDTLTRSLTEKYGTPGFRKTRGNRGSGGAELVWAWSSDGRPLPLNERHPCSSPKSASTTTILVDDHERRQSFLKPGCAKVVNVQVFHKNEVVDRLWVDAIDHASIDKAATQTRAFIENYVRGVEQQERDKASKTKGPKL